MTGGTEFQSVAGWWATIKRLPILPGLVENEPLVHKALADFKSSSADFADGLIGVKNRYAGCHRTLTFDRAAAGLSSFSSLD